jgi:homoserine O-succinyltransferase/O-acetyltransferase
VGRFMRGERDNYPNMPARYFDPATADLLNAFRSQALADRREELMSAFPAEHMFNAVSNTWHSQARCTYANWLDYIIERKASQTQPAPPARRAG